MINNLNLTKILDDSKTWALKVHQHHKYGKYNYFEGHLERVAIVASEIAIKEGINDKDTINFIKAVAYMHDYLEDFEYVDGNTLLNEKNKIEAHFGKSYAAAILILSRNYFNNTEEYYKTIAENLITKIVKTADRVSNLLMLDELNDKTKKQKLYSKYKNEVIFFEKYQIYPNLISKFF